MKSVTNKIIILWFVMFAFLTAQNMDVVNIKYNNQLLRDLSKEYFNNPDYWQTILDYNQLKSSLELKVGMNLKIPSELVKGTIERLKIANKLIEEANKNGAKVLTPKLIETVEFDYNSAKLLKIQRDWENSYSKLGDVISNANVVITKVNNLRKSSADATISYRDGTVEKRQPSQKLWNDAKLFSKLYEADRARTLDNSSAEITFIDLSRIRLNENSDAVIQHSRIDLLKNKTETKVKLVRGNAFAYLLKSPKKKFDIDIPGLDANIKSKSFWVEKGTADTKIANYEGEIELVSKTKAVVVGENQGSIIPDGGEPSNPRDLLPPPSLVSPLNKSKLFVSNVEFRWGQIEDVKNYWFQLSTDANFKNIVYSNKSLIDNSCSVNNLKPSIYYWRVCSIDEANLPGDFSSIKLLMVSTDNSKPFLVISQPHNLQIFKTSSITIVGETEKDANIFANGEKVKTNRNGEFKFPLILKNGKNDLIVTALDENNNKTQITVSYYYESSAEFQNKILNQNYNTNDSTFISDTNELFIDGLTRALSRVYFNYNNLVSSTFADTTGYYNIQLTNLNNKSNIVATTISPAGYRIKSNFRFINKKLTPKLFVENNIPKLTYAKKIVLKGHVQNCDSLFVNSSFVNLEGNSFSKTIQLNEGENEILFLLKGEFNNNIEESLFIKNDSTPPKLINYDFIKNPKKNNEFILRIVASDISGLPKIAKAVIEIDGVTKEIILLLDNKNEYSKSIYVTKSNSNPKLISVSLKDYLGNSKQFILGEK